MLHSLYQRLLWACSRNWVVRVVVVVNEARFVQLICLKLHVQSRPAIVSGYYFAEMWLIPRSLCRNVILGVNQEETYAILRSQFGVSAIGTQRPNDLMRGHWLAGCQGSRSWLEIGHTEGLQTQWWEIARLAANSYKEFGHWVWRNWWGEWREIWNSCYLTAVRGQGLQSSTSKTLAGSICIGQEGQS